MKLLEILDLNKSGIKYTWKLYLEGRTTKKMFLPLFGCNLTEIDHFIQYLSPCFLEQFILSSDNDIDNIVYFDRPVPTSSIRGNGDEKQ